MGKIWHRFEVEKPGKDGKYVCIVPLNYGLGYMVADLLYFTRSGAFNWDGNDEDTTMAVTLWAEMGDFLDQAFGEEE